MSQTSKAIDFKQKYHSLLCMVEMSSISMPPNKLIIFSTKAPVTNNMGGGFTLPLIRFEKEEKYLYAPNKLLIFYQVKPPSRCYLSHGLLVSFGKIMAGPII